MAESDATSPREQPPDSINRFVVTGDFGFHDVDGPFEVEKGGTKWTVVISEERYRDGGLGHLDHTEGCGCVLLADCEVVGGGIVDAIHAPEGEGEIHFVVDQYARGVGE